MNSRGSALIESAMMHGVEALPVYVEVAVTAGLPGMTVAGMVDATDHEARERVRCAVKAAGFCWPREKVIVHLGPAAMKKQGSGYDLPIAIGVLVATGQIDPKLAEGRIWVGELALDGTVRVVLGALSYAELAEQKQKGLVLSASEGALHDGDWRSEMIGIESLADLREGGKFAPLHREPKERAGYDADYSDVLGHARAKRACQVAAAGGHGILLVGPTGAGKTMLASRIPTIMPDMEERDRRYNAKVLCALGEDVSEAYAGKRPLRMPHNSATMAGLIGGGNPIKPGEVTLACGGVLLLEDVNEYSPAVLQSLRSPAKTGEVRIPRREGVNKFAARFLLAATSTPCPCGHFGDPDAACTCTSVQVQRYQSRMAGSIADMMPIKVCVCAQKPWAPETGSSAELRAGVEAAWEYRDWRHHKNGDDDGSLLGILAACRFDDSAQRAYERKSSAHALSGREIVDVLKVSRTIADIAEDERVREKHFDEAIGYRAPLVQALRKDAR